MRLYSFALSGITAAIASAVLVGTANSLQAQAGSLRVSASPALIIGNNEADESTTFGVVVGATRLADGRIIVGDRGDYSIRVFSPQGKMLSRAARKGSGPGEMIYLSDLRRCGDSIHTYDIENNHRRSVFALDLTYKREYRWLKQAPYRSACNAQQEFVQYGWEPPKSMKGGVFRSTVPFWITTPDERPSQPLGEYPGSERWGLVDGGQLRGTRPLPFGKEPQIAIGAQRAYVGTGDKYEIMMFDLNGKQVGVIRDATSAFPVTKADIAAEIELQAANRDAETRARLERAYAEMKLPELMPAHGQLRVDALDQLWVQDYPRLTSKTVRWSVFTSDGKSVGRVMLPAAFEIYEIGRNYILGRFMDPDVAIPQVHLYTLTR